MNRFLLWFGGLWFVVGASFAAGGIYMFSVEQQFAREAQLTTGTLLTKDVNRSTRRGRTRTTYSVRYRFAAPGDQIIEGKSDVPYNQWTQFTERQPIEIAYLPSDPSSNRLHGTNRTTLAAVFTGVGSAFAIAGAVIAWFGIREGRRHRRLHETGLVADAEVTDVRAARLRVNGRQQGRVHYEFRDAMGGLQSGKTSYMPVDDAMRWKQGDRIRIRYDRDQPRHSILEETGHDVSA